MKKAIRARYEGICAVCGCMILKGDLIERKAGGWAHVDCEPYWIEEGGDLYVYKKAGECRECGGTLVELDAYAWKCVRCGQTYGE